MDVHRAFKYGHAIPTHEEVAGVADDILLGLSDDMDLPRDEALSRISALVNETLTQPAAQVAPKHATGVELPLLA